MAFRRKPRKGDGPIYEVLRNQVLTLVPHEVGLAPTADLPSVFGFVMDMAYPTGTATLVAVADGATSLYTSSGGGMIGGGGHAAVASANRSLLATANAHLDWFQPANRDALEPLPAAGRTRMTVLTYEGPRAVEAPEDDFGYERHPASEVFRAAQSVITALRVMEEVATASASLPDDATPLMAAAFSGNFEAASVLVANDDPIDARDVDGYTALMYAANAGATPIVQLLLERGADPNARGAHGLAPLDFARQNGHDRIAAALIAAGAM